MTTWGGMAFISLTWLMFLISGILMQTSNAFSIGVWATVAIEGIIGPIFVYLDFLFFESASNYLVGSSPRTEVIKVEEIVVTDPNADSPFVEIEFLRKLKTH